jgi:hypothetical protein
VEPIWDALAGLTPDPAARRKNSPVGGEQPDGHDDAEGGDYEGDPDRE